VMARDVRAAYDKAAPRAAPRRCIPVGEAWTRAIQTGVADRQSVRRHRGRQARSLDLRPLPRQHLRYYLEALVVFGACTGAIRARSATRVLGFELGSHASRSRRSAGRLRSARGRRHDQAPHALGSRRPATPARCTAG
jgi:hypothetical protein